MLRQRRVHPGPPDRHPRRRQAPADERERPRRRRPRLGARRTPRTTRRGRDIPEKRALLLPRSAIPEVRQPRPARHRHAARSSRRASTRDAASSTSRAARTSSVYLDLTHLPTRSSCAKKLGGILEIYEKFVGVDPHDEADEDLPRRPLLDGRPVGRLRDGRRRRLAQPARRATRRPTSPASTPSARATTSTTAPTASAPTRCCPASSAAWSPARRSPRYVKNLAQERLRLLKSSSSTRPRSASASSTSASSQMDGERRTRTGSTRSSREIMLRDCTIERHNADARQGASRRSTSSTSAWHERRRHRHVAAREPGRAVRAPPAEHAGPRARHRAGRDATATSRAARTSSPSSSKRDDANWLRTTLAHARAGAAAVKYVRELRLRARRQADPRHRRGRHQPRGAARAQVRAGRRRERRGHRQAARGAAEDAREHGRERDDSEQASRQNSRLGGSSTSRSAARTRRDKPETQALGGVRGPLPAADERHQRAAWRSRRTR